MQGNEHEAKERTTRDGRRSPLEIHGSPRSRADGAFYYSVKTTGVYCRPSCAARRALPENVSFHATREDAEKAGLRPCKRCKPDQPSLAEQHVAIVAQTCRLIEETEKAPSLKELAKLS